MRLKITALLLMVKTNYSSFFNDYFIIFLRILKGGEREGI